MTDYHCVECGRVRSSDSRFHEVGTYPAADRADVEGSHPCDCGSVDYKKRTNDMTDYDTTRKIVETEIGYRTTIKSKRGTGTRDQDEVRVEARTETYPDPTLLRRMEDDVTMLMNERRAHHPDGDGDG